MSAGRAAAPSRMPPAAKATTMSASVLSATDTKPSTTNCSATWPPGRVDELRDEGEEEGCRLRVQRLDQHCLRETPAAVRPPLRPDPPFRPAGCPAGRLERADAEPDQIGGADQLQRREELRAREHDGGNAEAAGKDVDHAAEPGAEARGHAFRPAAGERARGDVEEPGPGRDGEHERRGEVQGELGQVRHDEGRLSQSPRRRQCRKTR